MTIPSWSSVAVLVAQPAGGILPELLSPLAQSGSGGNGSSVPEASEMSNEWKRERRGWSGYTWWLDDWRGSMAYRALNAECRSCYRELCEWQWTESGKAGRLVGLKDDDIELSLRAGVSLERWREIKPEITRWMTLLEDGWHQKKVDSEVESFLAIREERSKAGKASGEARREQTRNKIEHVLNKRGTNSEQKGSGSGSGSGSGLNSNSEKRRTEDADVSIAPKILNDDDSAAHSASAPPGSQPHANDSRRGSGAKRDQDATTWQPDAFPSVGKISHIHHPFDGLTSGVWPMFGPEDEPFELEERVTYLVKLYGNEISKSESGRGRARVTELLCRGFHPVALCLAIERYAAEIPIDQEKKRSCASFFADESTWIQYTRRDYQVVYASGKDPDSPDYGKIPKKSKH